MSAIVCRQGQGPKQTHGAKWHCTGTGEFGRGGKKIQNYGVVKRNVSPKTEDKNNLAFKNCTEAEHVRVKVNCDGSKETRSLF